MGKNYLMGIDIGTSESKGVICDEDGNIIAFESKAHKTDSIKPGFFEHDPDAIWYENLCFISKKLIQKGKVQPSDIKSLAVSAIGPCVLPLDRDGKPLRKAILYGIDTRSTNEIKYLGKKYSEDIFINTCGNTLSTQAAGPKILWIKANEPEIYEKTKVFVTSTTYLVYKLTSKMVIDYYTACAGYTPLFDYNKMCWSEMFCEEIGGSQRLPQLKWSSDAAGKLTEQAALDTGLSTETTVAVGTCDAAAEAFSVGVTSNGKTMLMIGSTVFIIHVCDKPIKDKRLWGAPFLFEGTFSLLAAMGSAGLLTKWFKDNFVGGEDSIAESEGKDVYDIMAGYADDVSAGSGGLIVLPYFTGERTPINNPDAKGIIFGLTLDKTKKQIYRAFLESVGFGIKDNFMVMLDQGIDLTDVMTVGGGTKNTPWLQIISDITGITQKLNQVTIGASYGDAFLGGLAVGIFNSPEDISKWIRKKAIVTPNVNNKDMYDKGFIIYKSLYEKTKGLM